MGRPNPIEVVMRHHMKKRTRWLLGVLLPVLLLRPLLVCAQNMTYRAGDRQGAAALRTSVQGSSFQPVMIRHLQKAAPEFPDPLGPISKAKVPAVPMEPAASFFRPEPPRRAGFVILRI